MNQSTLTFFCPQEAFIHYMLYIVVRADVWYYNFKLLDICRKHISRNRADGKGKRDLTD